MSRITAKAYLHVHHYLQKLWQEHQVIFAELTAQAQWLLHDYFRPASILTDAELLIHRKTISIQRPSLPQQAGKAYASLITAVAAHAARVDQMSSAPPVPRRRRSKRHDYNVTVATVVRPLDPHAFARSFAKAIRAEAAAAVKAAILQTEAASVHQPGSTPTAASSVPNPVASPPDSATDPIRTAGSLEPLGPR